MKTKKPIITFQVEPAEEEALNSYLVERGIKKRSPFLREAVFGWMKSDQPQLTKDMVHLFEAWRKEFHGVGSNLNQIAYKMNAKHPLSTNEILEVLEALKAHFKMLDDRFWNLRHDLEL